MNITLNNFMTAFLVILIAMIIYGIHDSQQENSKTEITKTHQ